ncbi:MAG: 16S rRNA (uracil(1498)-N(3))-methyltransferase [FCB group bacterium]|nr:16S rRNA (uracil(1498)-N(3))-methyltransferase [FCB group bacterium]MBL7028906.1 16S rRNA (uracil(1498)-N(3))-methyltransferase [Candidatus Neomarinimicrobiota bacterium]MBL7122744.1 16S rRNA (uracil(1498)-N(3))-methyltransferase [Candidatus Neomarinimicrobiota bacterium]
MNLILLNPNDFIAEDRVRLSGRRFKHISTVHRAEPDSQLRVGLLNGKTGHGLITQIEPDFIELTVTLTQPPPERLQVTLLLALPRPKMLKRVMQSITSLGVKQIYLINSYRVEKSFWSSPLLQPENLHEQLLLGLEQARDTILPEVHLRQRFKPFVEDELPELCKGTKALVAHPASEGNALLEPNQPTTLAIGPEGGFIPFEVDMLAACGFTAFSFGERILRVETAVPAILSRLLPI